MPTGSAVSAASRIEQLTALVPDFPKPGVLFRDLTPVFGDAAAFRSLIDELSAPFSGRFDLVAGVEARGFVLAAAIGYATGTGVVALRKAGKLPPPVISESYDLEYGSESLELREHGGLPSGAKRVLLVDDVLATGGTLSASSCLLARAGLAVIGISVVLELDGLDGRSRLGAVETAAISVV